MDDEFQELEAELKRLRPAAASRELTVRVEHALGVSRRSYWTWAALPFAAVMAGAILLKETRPVSAPQPAPATASVAAVFKPVSAENVLYDHQDEGLVTLADGTAARRYRTSYVDTITWRNPRTQASLRWSVPRTEERVVPVSFQ
jgi:hypothetical protein